MSKTLLKCSRAVLLVYLTAVGAHADFEYFDRGLDFWNEQNASKKEGKQASETRPKEATMSKGKTEEERGSFPWEKYLDPKNREFFKEGEHIPPEPFMEIARNPTDYNLRMWFQYMDKKNELAERLQVKMKEYVEQNELTPPAKEDFVAKGKRLPIASPDARRYQFRMYFNSQCPHCRKMFETLSTLQSKGFYVEARQVDAGKYGLSLPFPVEMASKNEIREKDIQAVPLLLVGDLNRKVVYRMQGYQNVESVFARLKNEANRALGDAHTQ